MTFTDDDLKRLKEDLKYSGLNKSPFSSEHSVRTLIARLEAAENLIASETYGYPERVSGTHWTGLSWENDACDSCKALEKWRKAGGREIEQLGNGCGRRRTGERKQ